MSPMIAWAIEIRPPPPIPWTARNRTSSSMFCDNPASIDPATKMTIAAWKTTLRPTRSLTFPYSGTETVDVNRYAVTTHER
jgi:hypothetical protein